MAYSNGRIPDSALAPITKAVNGEQAYLIADAAKAFNAMNAESERRFGVTLRVSSARAAYRSYEDQEYFWRLYQSGQGNLAARPGTSNHGLGLAVDLATTQMRKIVDQIGSKYGWSKATSDAPSEWWHLKWKPGKYKAVEDAKWFGYTDSERRWIEEYDKLKKANKNRARRAVLRTVMLAQRQRIYRAAQKDGWNKQNRRARYNSLKARS
jgi:hypothetical protein